jgi:DNA (cytosine-5)-methyltransferase 1
MEKKIKVLNLYAGIGGNRRLWNDELVDVTAVEIEPEIAEAYKHFFPNDKVIIGDAHTYLLEHFKEFEFIWSSPPCPTHSVMGLWNMKKPIQNKPYTYPEMSLYQEIIFLKHFFKGKWVVENTRSYYEPLIKPYESGAHYFWSNFHITNQKANGIRPITTNIIKEKQKITGFNLDGFSFKNMESSHKKDKILNNCVDSKLGLHIFNCAFKTKQKTIMEIVPKEIEV